MKKLIASALLKARSRTGTAAAEELERPHFPEPGQTPYNDSYYFTAHGNDGCALITRLGFRSDGVNEQWFIFITPGGREYRLDETAVPAPDDHTSGNLRYSCLDPGSAWEIRYEGPLVSDGETVHAEFKGIFTSHLPLFDFGADMPPGPMAAAMARQRWSRKWFEQLKTYSQTHYEQGGGIEGEFSADESTVVFSAGSVRDHSFGPREWGFMERHAWITGILDNGAFFNLSLVDYPILEGISAGYISAPEADSSSSAGYAPLKGFPTIGSLVDGNTVPEKIDFTVRDSLGRTVEVSVRGERAYTWTLGGNYSLTERISRFEIGGVKGRGILEFGRRLP